MSSSKSSIFILSVMLLGLSACKTPKLSKASESTTIPIESATIQKDTTDFSVLEKDTLPILSQQPYTLLYFKKEGCYGVCPSYEWTIMSDGTSTYNGLQDVPKIGKYIYRLDEEQTKAIYTLATMYDFHSFPERMPSDGKFIAELPNTEILMNFNGKRTKIVENHNAPDRFYSFEEALESLLKSFLK